jgi:BlaI family transcriptional regulator, penicillinase repressor
MPRKALPRPTDVELEILNVLWNLGEASVRQIHDALKATRTTGYSTTLKMVQVMHEKGLVTRDESVRPQIFRAAASQEDTQLHMLDDLTERVFGGSASRLVMRLVASEKLSEEELAELNSLLKKDKKKGNDDERP